MLKYLLKLALQCKMIIEHSKCNQININVLYLAFWLCEQTANWAKLFSGEVWLKSHKRLIETKGSQMKSTRLKCEVKKDSGIVLQMYL